uniref:Uncharacterized protein n=1 Tax=Rhizophagus irregularis (strain DAOM 181602 / DAOM 197198 / MUCL 43194) TaxID=747089 RepID=U9SVN8_RHIID
MHKVPAIKTPATTSISIDKLANWLAGPGVKSKSLQTNAEWFVYMENLPPPRTSFSHPRVEIGKAGSGPATQEKRGECNSIFNDYWIPIPQDIDYIFDAATRNLDEII